MATSEHHTPADHGFRPLSNLATDVWHDDRNAGAYEWWYFDAVSNDGRECFVVIFLTGFIFSPRYNRAVADWKRNPQGREPQPTDYPAVVATLYRDGRVAWRAIQEFTAPDFAAERETVACRIGNNRLLLEPDSTRRRIFVTLNLPLRDNTELQANFHWELPEVASTVRMETSRTPNEKQPGVHEWNLVAPRCAVSGSFRTYHHGTHKIESAQFVGTGYHDHNRDTRWLPATVAEWQWGRAHFADNLTAVFYRYRERGQGTTTTKLFLAQPNQMQSFDATYNATSMRRDKFGLRYPQTISLKDVSDAASKLEIFDRQILDSSFFYLRFRDRARLTLTDGRSYEAVAISEELAPRALLRRKLDWLVNMRIGRNGKPAFLK